MYIAYFKHTQLRMAKQNSQFSITNIMKQLSFTIILLLFYNLFLKGQPTIFKDKEFLKYEMSYGWITGGVASLTLEKTTLNGKKVFHVKAVGRTVGIAHTIFHVEDIYESYFDPVTCKPYKSRMSLKENKYRNYNVVWYNHAAKTLYSKKSGNHKIKVDNIFDIVSSFYRLRQRVTKLYKGQEITIHTYFHDEPWDLVVKYKGIEVIKTKFGKLKCMKFNPVVEEGTFASKDALDIWISADKNRIPVRVKMKLFVGSFSTDLVEYKNIVYPLGSQ